jgi:hypothetical protein
VSDKRRWLVAVTLLVAIISGGWFVFVLTQETDHPLGRRNYQRIRVGMTRDEVGEILGASPGVTGQATEQLTFVELVEQEGPVDTFGGLAGKPEVWFSERGQIIVKFDTWDRSGRVVGKQLYRPASRR